MYTYDYVNHERLSTVAYPTVAYPTVAYPTVAYPTVDYPTVAYPTVAYPTVAYPTVVSVSPEKREINSTGFMPYTIACETLTTVYKCQ